MNDSCLPGEILAQFPDARIGHYSITGVVGEGGQGVVLRLENGGGNVYTGKVIHRRWSLTPWIEDLRGLRRGVEISQRLEHPGIQRFTEVLDLPEKSMFVVVKEYAPGRSLREMIDAEGHVEPTRLVSVLDGALDALQYLHDERKHPDIGSVCHRDIKPEHIIVDDTGLVRLIDMDTSKATGGKTTQYTAVGTKTYAHPEALLGGTSPVHDIYSLGFCAVEALLGKVPQELSDSRLPGRKAYSLPEWVREDLKAIVDRMVDPEKGYFGASDVRKDLILCLQGQEEKTAMVPHEHDDALERQRNALRIAENLVEQNRKDLREHLQMVAGGTAGLGVAYVGVVYEYYGPLTAMGALVGITWFGMGAGMTLVTGMEYFTRRKLLRHEKEKAEMLLELDPEIRHLKEERIQEYEKLDTWAHLGMKGCTLASTAIGIVAGGAYLWQDNPFMAGLSGATGAAGVAFAEFMRRSATKPVRDNIKRLEEKIAYLSPRGEWVPEPETRDTKPLFCYYPDSFVQQIQRVAERYKDQGIDCRIEGDFNANNSAYELRIHVQCDDNGEGHNVMLERSSEGIPERPRFHFYKDGNTDAISAIFGLPPCGFNLGINEVVNGHHRSPHSVKDGALTEYPVDTGRHMHEEVLGRYARFMRTLEVRAPELLKLLDSRISRNMPATEEYKKEFSWRVSDTWRGRWTFADRLKYEGKETP